MSLFANLQKSALLLLLTLLMSGCVHMNTVSLSSIPAQREQVVSAESSRFLLFGISFSSDFVDEAVQSLSEQCNGKVEGIITKFETHNYFLYMFMSDVVSVKGFCR